MDYNSVDTKARLWVEQHREEISNLLTECYQSDYKFEEKYLLKEASTCNFMVIVLSITFFVALFNFNFTISVYCCGLVWFFLWLLCREVVKLSVNNFFRREKYYTIIGEFIQQQKEETLKLSTTETVDEIEFFYTRCLNRCYNESFKYKT